MGLLELDLPPIQLHASTQTDIRTPEKARFLQDVGLSQMVLARELTLEQIRAAIRAHQRHAGILHPRRAVRRLQRAVLHQPRAHRAQRQPRRLQPGLPAAVQVADAQGRIVAHDKHVLSLKDNNQSDNLEALVDAGIRSFKIEGRYKDMGYVKNITAHYRTLLDCRNRGNQGNRQGCRPC
jgi:collagenase-like PrtC family protease